VGGRAEAIVCRCCGRENRNLVMDTENMLSATGRIAGAGRVRRPKAQQNRSV
jgi:hypothetical protein